jgi:hypothetical protein
MLLVSLLALVLAFVVFRRFSRSGGEGSALNQLASIDSKGSA